MTDEQTLTLILSVSGAIISALVIALFKLYQRINSEAKTELMILIKKIEDTNNLSREIMDDFKTVISNMERRLSIEEFKLQTHDDLSNKLFKQIDNQITTLVKKTEMNSMKISELDLEIKLLRKEMNE